MDVLGVFAVESETRYIFQSKKEGYFLNKECLLVFQTNKVRHLYPENCLNEEKRTDAFIREQVRKLMDDNTRPKLKREGTKGVLFCSPMIPMITMEFFNMVKGFPLDYMHCVLLGVVKQLTTALITANKTDNYHLGKIGMLFQMSCILTSHPGPISRLSRIFFQRDGSYRGQVGAGQGIVWHKQESASFSDLQAVEGP